MFDNPPIIHVFKCITCDLLLVAGPPSIIVPYWINVSVRVEPARLSRGRFIGVTQCDLGTKRYVQWLSFG